MLFRRQARRHGRMVARRLRSTLVQRQHVGGEIYPGGTWKIVPHSPIGGVTELENNQGFTITIQPSKQLPAVRIFDRCRLCYKGADMWLSLWQRLRLKNAARLYVAICAYNRA